MIRAGGFTPLSTADYPGCLSAVVFCRGCPWRCGYCHNPHLLDPDFRGGPNWDEILEFLERRKGLLDAVVFSGGEPTLQKRLAGALKEVREMGFRTGLHTSGAFPECLEAVFPYLDWVGMDVKAPFEDYEAITHAKGSGEKARRSVELILESNVEC
ncbi:MAG TPA: anaerobic ribonucleoside-triphosphate reductase activating protein, partial [Burkholderiales bacterium]|nr:anaerobic ribonucleoside-triphosphate reductase activating protein [Burkholderiales bacterium]